MELKENGQVLLNEEEAWVMEWAMHAVAAGLKRKLEDGTELKEHEEDALAISTIILSRLNDKEL